VELTLELGTGKALLYAPDQSEDYAERLTFWWGLTTASINLTRRILGGKDLLGVKALELGCGLGLAGIGALMKGAEVTFSDFMPEALGYAARNVALNNLDCSRAHFLELDWGNPVNLPAFDLILGAEIIYDYFFHASLIQTMEKALVPGGHILLADRKRLVVERFIGRLLSRGFSCEAIASDFSHYGFPDQEITIFNLWHS
jgi:predicted nicotinamide N-methyase